MESSFKQGEMLVIFPEGNIFRDGSLHPLKPGYSSSGCQYRIEPSGLGVKSYPSASVTINPSTGAACPNSHWFSSARQNYHKLGEQNAKHLTGELEGAQNLRGQWELVRCVWSPEVEFSWFGENPIGYQSFDWSCVLPTLSTPSLCCWNCSSATA